MIFLLLFSLLIWIGFFYGLISFIKKRIKNRSIKKENIETYTYSDQTEYPEQKTSINDSYNHYPDHEYTYENEENDSFSEKLSFKKENTSKEDLISEIKGNSETDSERKNRAISIGKYLNKNAFGEKIYILDKIPEEKISNANKSMKITPDDVPLALLDNTAFGSCKEGIVISFNGIYWKDSFESPKFLSWFTIKSLKESKNIKYEKSKIVFGANNIINFSMSQFNKEEGMSMIKNIIEDIV